jgi:hypothetical protein
MKKLKNFPFYPFFIAIYSVIALLAFNISEVNAGVAIRPLIVMLAGCGVLFLCLRLILKDWQKAGLVSGVWVFLFVIYGHLYQFFRDSSFFAGLLGRHRILIPVFILAAGVSLFWIWRKKAVNGQLSQILNILSILLILYPSFHVINSGITSEKGQKEASQWTFSQLALQPIDPENLPDVYYIVLDTYTSSKALAKDFSFDNSEFEAKLKEMGFYVAECSQTNYPYTQGAITAALNLDYLPELTKRLETINAEDNIWVLLKQSLVRNQLERLGYQTVAFETSYDWSRMEDADIYLGQAQTSLLWQQLNPFEKMWVDSTALLALSDMEIVTRKDDTGILDHPMSDHIQKQLFVLKTLPDIASNPDPTFTFAHILIPHVPYVFAADGTILTDPGYFGTDKAGPVNEDYLQKGYTGEIAFINNQMESILSKILEQSETPPIIVLMGDHGVRDENRTKILYAVYLPDGAEDLMYPSITPVNTFRVIFDRYFGTSYGLLPDMTYPEEGGEMAVPTTCE